MRAGEPNAQRPSLLARAVEICVLAGVAIALGFQSGFALKAFLGDVYAVNAQAAENEYDVDTARWSLARSLDWNPADYRIQYRYGVLQQRTENLEEAAQALAAVLHWAPHDVLAMLTLAELNASVGRFTEADRLIEEAESLLPGYWRTHQTTGIRFGNEGEHARAVREFTTALESGGPRAKPVLAQLATAHLALEELDTALTYATQSVAYDDSEPANHLLVGKILIAKDRASDSRVAFLRALNVFAESGVSPSQHRGLVAETYAYLSTAYAMDKELGNAIESLALAIDTDPKSVHVGRAADTLADELENFSREDVQTETGYGAILVGAGTLFLFLDQMDRAEPVLFDAYAGSLSDADRIGCELALAKVHLERNRPVDALNLIEGARNRATTPSVQIERALADALARNGRIAEAKLQYLDVLQRFQLTTAMRDEIERAIRALER
ncbi:MAG: hypothetical protein IID08_05890 [Candidatus Hydrogenedentes bacterium]|nr:hypothetical protein [Candidatus Hydrogenedentota bacterium]